MPRLPSILFGEHDEPGDENRQTPPSPPAPSVPFGTPKSQLPKSTTPKVIGDGVLRERIECSAADLRAIDPQADPAVLADALRLIRTLNLEDAHFDDVVRFGCALQVEHGEITEIELAIANHPAIQQAQCVFADVLAIFERLDPEALFAPGTPSLIQALRQWVAPGPSAAAVFRENYSRLLQAIDALKAHDDALAEAAARLAALQPRYATLVDRIASATLAANFIIDKFRKNPVEGALQAHYAAQIDVLQERSSSLLSTRATLETGRLTHAMLSRNLRALANASTAMLEENLPAFNAAYTAALAFGRPSHGAVADVQARYGKISALLKK